MTERDIAEATRRDHAAQLGCLKSVAVYGIGLICASLALFIAFCFLVGQTPF